MKHIEISKRIFHFKQPAGTSRGIYTTRQSYFLTLTDDSMPGIKGVGECAPLPKLSCDDLPDYETILHQSWLSQPARSLMLCYALIQVSFSV